MVCSEVELYSRFYTRPLAYELIVSTFDNFRAGVADYARRLARALSRLGVRPGDRIATLGMNYGRHLAVWFGVIGRGAVVHTINPRLFDDQFAYVANPAEDRVLVYDRAFAPLVERLKSRWTSIEHYFGMDGSGSGTLDKLMNAEASDFAWVCGDEGDPCMLCYTSGTQDVRWCSQWSPCSTPHAGAFHSPPPSPDRSWSCRESTTRPSSPG